MAQKFTVYVTVSLLVVVLATLSFSRPGLADEIQEIEIANTKWVEAFAKSDFEVIRATMAADSLLMSPNTPAVRGSDDVVEVWRGWADLAGVDIKWGANHTAIASSGDLAYSEGWYTFSFDTDNGRFEDVGKYIVIWKKVGGSWKVAVDIFNSDAPLAAN